MATTGIKKLASALANQKTWNRWRIKGKIMLSRLAYSIILLFAADTIIAAITQTLLHPAIAIAGLLWIALVVAFIWYRGGVVIDALFGAEIINLEVSHEVIHGVTASDKTTSVKKGFRPGHDFMQALALLIMIGVFISLFFLIVPIWQSWGLFLFLLIVLIGWRCAATLSDSKFDWNIVRKTYIVFAAAAAGLFFIIYSYEFMTGQAMTVATIRSTLQTSGIGKVLFWPILLIIGGLIFKKLSKPATTPATPVKKSVGGWLIAAGLICIAIVLLVAIFVVAKKELTAMGKEYDSSKGSARQTEGIKQEPIAETATITVIVPANKIVKTGFRHSPNKRVFFDKIGGGADDPSTPFYYVHGKTIDIPVYSSRHSCQYPREDYVWLKGGPVTSIIKISM